MQATPKNEDWLPKAAAAKLLGASPRQLERRQAQGYIEKKLGERKPTDRSAPVFYSRADILAFKSGTPNMHAREVSDDEKPELAKKSNLESSPSAALAVRRDSRGPDPWDILAAHLAKLGALYPSPAMPGPFVGLADAVTLSGMPASWLLAQARAGVTWAVNVGTGKREFWRFSIATGARK